MDLAKDHFSQTTSPTLTRAFIFVETEDFQRAEEYCEKELDLNPTNGDAYFCLLMAELHVSDKEKLKDIKGIETQKNFQLAKKFASDALLQELENIEKYRQETEKLEKIARENIEKEREEKLNRLNLIKKESLERYLILRQHLSAAKKLKEKKEVLKVLESALHYEKILSENDNPDDLTVEEVKSQTEQVLAQAGSLDEKLELINKNSLKNRAKLKKKVAIFLGVILILATALIIKFMIDQERREIAHEMGLVLGKWDTSCLVGFTGTLMEYELPDFITKIDIDHFGNDTSPAIEIVKLTISEHVTSITNRSLAFIPIIEISPENKIFEFGDYGEVINKKEKCLLHLPESLKAYTISKDIVNIDSSVLRCLRSVELEQGNQNLILGKSGELIDKKTKTLLFVPADIVGEYKIPEEVENIDNYVFMERRYLNKIIIPDHVKYIGYFAFWDLSELEIKIPESVKIIKEGAFSGVKKVTLARGNKYFKTGKHDELIDIKNKTLLYVPKDIPAKYTIPDGVKRIGMQGFFGCDKLEEVELPESLETIGTLAFNRCTSLKKIKFSNGLKTIGSRAFFGCAKLQEIDLPKTLETIGSYAFLYCSGLEEITIPERVEHIESGAIRDIKKVKLSPKNKNFRWDKDNILIDVKKKKIIYCSQDFKGKYEVPEDIKEIGNFAFYCTELEEISLPKEVRIIGMGAFSKCTKLEEISLPKEVRIIGMGAFSNCTELKEISLSEELRTIGAFAFARCLNLKEIDLPTELNTIGSNVFFECKNLKEIKIPEKLKYIGTAAFSDIGNVKLSSKNKNFKLDKNKVLIDIQKKKIIHCSLDFEGKYNVPNEIAAIGEGAFSNCTKLEEITLPNGLQSVGGSAFSDCSGLKKIKLPEGIKSIGEFAFSGCSGLKEIKLPDTLKSIGDHAFFGCSGLKEIKLPDTLKSIGNHAFSGCSGLKEIKLPDGISVIGYNTFRDCHNLTKIRLAERLRVIESDAFSGCSGLKEIKLPDGLKVISSNAFSSCSGLKEIKLPDGLKVISSNAFSYCSGLKEIKLPKELEVIGSSAFSGCSSLKGIEIPEKVNTIGFSAFGNIKNIKFSPRNKNFRWDKGTVLIDINRKKIILRIGDLSGKYHVPDDITEIESNVFNGSDLEEITLPEGLKRIGGCAFSGCYKLKEISLPKGITVIDNSTFSYCRNLTKIRLPEGLRVIESSAFEGCSSLEEISIPSSVTKIHVMAFADTRLKEISIPKHFTDEEIKIWGLSERCKIIRK